MTDNNLNGTSPYQPGAVVSPGSGSGVNETLENSYGIQNASLYPSPVGTVWSSPYIDNQPTGTEMLWGNLYALPDNSASQTSVLSRDMEYWGLRKSDNQWVLLQSSNSKDTGIWQGNTNPGFGGAKYDYPTVTTQYGPIESFKVQDGVASFNPGNNDQVEHWWPTNKPEDPWARYNPGDYEGYYAKAEMRIEGADANSASYVAQIGVDPHFGHGRWNKLTTGWQNYSITNLPESKLRSTPPPDETGTSSSSSAARQVTAGASLTVANSAIDTSSSSTAPIEVTAKEKLTGADGIDYITGGAANENIVGGLGEDILTGGDGADSFSFYSPTDGVDTIADFSSFDDNISVSAIGFGGDLIPGSAITTDQLCLGAGATAANNGSQRFIYDTVNGTLFFDADGNGTTWAAVQIAMLTSAPNLTDADIFVNA